jgi:prepilin-type N-terminal cleavage/methylation domain-containing protein
MRRTGIGGGRPGFSLVEVVVALTVLAVGILGLSATVGVVARRMNFSLLETWVTTCAQAELEDLLARPIDLAASGERRHGGLEVTWQVSGDDPKEIQVIVRGRLAGSEVADTLTTLASVR